MAYDTPDRRTYTIPSVAFGATTTSQIWVGPKGRKGLVRDITVLLTADAVGTTSVPEVTVGAAAGATDYARLRLGTTATAGYVAASENAVSARALAGGGNGLAPTLSDFPGHVALETAQIPADTEFFISGKAGVGGSPAGTGIIRVEIDWF